MSESAPPSTEKARVSTAALTGVPETLLIPLVGRARARRFYPHLAFADPFAEEILSRIDADVRPFERDTFTQRGMIIRARAFDAIARRFFLRHPDGLGVSLGAGLCTRFLRVAPLKGAWVDIDLPEVVALKRQLVPESDRYRFLSASLFESGWREAIGWTVGRPILLQSEGVLVYFPPAKVRELVTGIAEHFHTGAELAFDYVQPLLAKGAALHPSVRHTRARFGWGTTSAERVSRWHPRLAVIDDLSLVDGLGVVSPFARLLHLVAKRHPYGLAHLRVASEPR